MALDINRAREVHFSRMQKALAEGLRAINDARTPAEAEVAPKNAQQRLEKLNRLFAEAFGDREFEQILPA